MAESKPADKLTLESVKCPKCGAQLEYYFMGSRKTRARIVRGSCRKPESDEQFVRCPDCGREDLSK